MRTIWKFPLGAGPRGVSEVERAVVDPDAAKERRVFLTYGTGHLHETIRGEYVGTYQLLGGALVFHVFEQRP